MAKINLKDFPAHLRTAISKALDEATTVERMQDIGDDLAEQIRVRTRLGNGLGKNGGEPSKLKKLSKEYIEQRKTNKELSEFTTPTKSNLTLTGEMLDELKATADKDKITLSFDSQFSKDKARWNDEKGRPFLYVSRVQVERLKNSLEKKITELLKKYL